MARFVGLVIFVLFCFYLLKDVTSRPDPIAVSDEFYETPKKKSVKRIPASLIEKNRTLPQKVQRPNYRETIGNEKNFAPEIERVENSESEKEVSSVASWSPDVSIPYSTGYSRQIDQTSSSPRQIKSEASASNSSISNSAMLWGPTTTPFVSDSEADKPVIKKEERESGGVPYNSSSISCNVDQGAGAYNTPIFVSLLSSVSGTIRYSLSDNGCTNPSLVYSGGIVVGEEDGQYCLSYYCEDKNGKMSEVKERLYTITSLVPTLQVSHPITQYQTTELNGTSFLKSQSFGQQDYEMGQVNLRFDPGARTTDCDYLYENYVAYPLSNPPIPKPFEILASLGLDTINSGSQIEVPLLKDDLDYGENFIMSYIVDSRNPMIPQYACSTQAVVLNDFEFFEEFPSHGEVGTDTVREFAGGLSPYGFFEEESVVYRGPAGLSTDDQSGQRLETGLFQVFY